MVRLLLDTDPGINDASGLCLALVSPELQSEAITFPSLMATCLEYLCIVCYTEEERRSGHERQERVLDKPGAARRMGKHTESK